MCLYPVRAWRCVDIETGEVHLDFKYSKSGELISLPCGKCPECLIHYSNEWALRCMLEASLHKHNCLITLTYSHAPESVSKRDLQLFVKRLRKHISPVRVRFFGSGEYGKKALRPHYHIIIFGWRPLDLDAFFYRDDHWVYKSSFVARVWNKGFISVEDVTFRSALYCAKYLQKLQVLPAGLEPPFTLMSLKPGIGLLAFDPRCLETDCIPFHGRSYSVPRYFERKYPGDYTVASTYRCLKADLLKSSLLDRRKKYKILLGG